jgi:adenine-specific DNA-methyltransferase
MPDPVRWGPDNPHPLSRMRTELVWDGKYDEYGRRRTVDVAGAAFPMQKIETVDMPKRDGLERFFFDCSLFYRKLYRKIIYTSTK